MKHLLITGKAGSGKTHTAIATALKSKQKIVIIRNVVTVRDIGFLPGTIDEKIEPFFALYKEIFRNCGCKTPLEVLVKKNRLQLESTSFLRGITFNDCHVIVDEAQNMSYEELTTILTRLGKDSRLIVVGDLNQMDLCQNESGFVKFCSIFTSLKKFVHHVQLKEQHRSELLTAYFAAEDRYSN